MTDKERYEELIPQIESVLAGETDETAVMANTATLLHHTFAPRFFWTGFYRVVSNELLLGAFQGTLACMHIGYGRGVCGTAWQRGETIIVDDVETFPGHIACSSLSRSEIVVPLKDSHGTVRAVLDIDSTDLKAFTAIDGQALEQVAAIVAKKIYG